MYNFVVSYTYGLGSSKFSSCSPRSHNSHICLVVVIVFVVIAVAVPYVTVLFSSLIAVL